MIILSKHNKGIQIIKLWVSVIEKIQFTMGKKYIILPILEMSKAENSASVLKISY